MEYLLGSCITEESRADCVLETEREHMGGSTMTLENMGGIVSAYGKRGVFWNGMG